MCKEYEENRRTLKEIIDAQEGEFTEGQIIREYRKRRGHLMVDIVHSISSYLRELKDLDGLSYSKGRYSVK